MPARIVDMAPDAPPAARLLAAQAAELDARYGKGDLLPPATADLGPPGGAFLVACDAEGEALGCGALRRFDERTAELKRMYTVPHARGHGVGRALLATLEQRAVQLGYERMCLETGTLQPAAMWLYRSAGYVPVPCWEPYAADPLSRCFARALGAPR